MGGEICLVLLVAGGITFLLGTSSDTTKTTTKETR